ncbi:MAG: hypothetical protein H6732_04545 [Alphaproteobacteria bacterium]|nr:hypothetical protein [Alphaproteobacteria bacterium]
MTPSIARSPAALVLLALTVGACGKNPGAYQTAAADAAKATDDVGATLASADALWEERIDPDKLREGLDLYAKVVAADPLNRKALERLTRGWYFLGDSHLTDKQEKIDTWATAITWGKQCLALNDDFRARVQTEKEKDAVTSLQLAEVPCLYWTASALGKWGKIQGVAKVLGQLPTVKAYITRAEELDPTFFHYGPARYWGAYFSASSFTWDEEKSTQYFEASIEGAPYYLPTRGLRAEQLAVKTKDFATFKADIDFILGFDVSENAELVPENTLEKTKAQALWDKRAELFDADVLAAAGAE